MLGEIFIQQNLKFPCIYMQYIFCIVQVPLMEAIAMCVHVLWVIISGSTYVHLV